MPISPHSPVAAPAASHFIPVCVETVGDEMDGLDLYLKHRWDDEPTLYRPSGVALTDDDRARLAHQHVDFLHIPVSQHIAYRKEMVSRLESLYDNPDIRESARATAVRSTCTRMIEEVLAAPSTAESIDGVSSLSRKFASWAIEDESKFSYLLDMSEHDFYTATHMLNVGVGCGLLVRKLRPNDEELLANVMQGGLVHDVGKRSIPTEILNKEQGLTSAEWETIKAHPVLGYKELAATDGVSAIGLEMTRSHHERLDGKGYPDKLFGKQIGYAARICAVVDSYDAITSGRPYRGPISPRDAIEILREGANTQFDEEILEVWLSLVTNLIEKDQSRTFEREGPPPDFTLDDLFPETPEDKPKESATARKAKKLDPSDRRTHPRFHFISKVTATFIRQCKPYHVRVGQTWNAETIDCSRGGVCLATPWPLARGDVLELQMESKRPDNTTRTILKYAVVLNVHSDEEGDWSAGMRFIEDPEDPYAS